jgi:tetratricopeptide (TPR) repeat protein
MKRAGVWKTVFACTMILVLAASAGCRKKEDPRVAEVGTVNLDALNEIENYKTILRKDPGNLQAHISLGNLYYDTGQDIRAIEHYGRALAFDPRNVNVRTDMAVCYRRSGDPDRAVEELKKAISIDPRHYQSRYNLGIILIHDKKDIEGGVRAWEALLENVPDYPYRDSLGTEIARMRAILSSTKRK